MQQPQLALLWTTTGGSNALALTTGDLALATGDVAWNRVPSPALQQPMAVIEAEALNGEGGEIVIADAMAELAAAGSHTRLALTPRRDRRIWSADRQCPIAVHELPDSVAPVAWALIIGGVALALLLPIFTISRVVAN